MVKSRSVSVLYPGIARSIFVVCESVQPGNTQRD